MTVECIASCSSAPALQVNDEFVENVTIEKADALLAELERDLTTPKSPLPEISRSESSVYPDALSLLRNKQHARTNCNKGYRYPWYRLPWRSIVNMVAIRLWRRHFAIISPINW